MMSYIVAVDSGGTFTDCVVLDEVGTVTRAKALSTPPRFEEGVLSSIASAAERLGLTLQQLLGETAIFAHGTTVATNLLITGGGAKTALLTTAGHEDAIIIGRTVQKVAGLAEAEIIDVANLTKAEPLVPRSRIHGVDERVDRNGDVVVPLSVEGLRALADRLRAEGVESIAISLLWSFRNPKHERELQEWLTSHGSESGNGSEPWFVTASSDLVPVIREYERASTTALNAYLTPSVNGYLQRMRTRLHEEGHQGAIAVMHSAGGVSSIDEARERGVTLLSSGPAGGILGARSLAERLDLHKVIATDVGGTSFDVGLIVDGEPSYAEAPIFAKYPVALPVIDVTSIGAGGGSIAWIEPDTGILRVGPRSAGASPGPVCYGGGGVEPTVTDANLVLGRLNADYFLGGRMKLDVESAAASLTEQIADPLGLGLEEAASSIIDIVDSQMADLIRKVTVERGLDPARFSVFCFGGAGGLHACSYARQLRCEEVVVPAAAAVFSAYGIGVSDAKRVELVSDPMREPFDLDLWKRRFEGLEAALEAELREERLPTDNVTLRRYVDLQFRGQVHTVRVSVDEADLSAADDGERVIERFVALYEDRYGPGTSFRRAGVEAMTFVVEALARLPIPVPDALPVESDDASPARRGERTVFVGGRFASLPVFSAELLRSGNTLTGPAIVEAEDTTVLIHGGQTLRVDGFLNLRVSVGESA